MKEVSLLNTGKIPHYRVPIYNYLRNYLMKHGYILNVISEGVEECNPHYLQFNHDKMLLCYKNLKAFLQISKPDAVIFWVEPHLYMIPIFLIAKILNVKIIHWGHRRPLPSFKFLKKLVYNFEHWIDDAVILYTEEFKRYVYKPFWSKTFIANNTLNFTHYSPHRTPGELIKKKYGIFTKQNIICMGRMQKRKRIEDLIQAFRMLNLDDVGLILAGPDNDGILRNIEASNIYKTGAVYGEECLDLLSLSDVYCLPGAIGLSIVDAFYCGLPIVTENVMHGPEIMYLKDGINGFITPVGDISQLSAKLKMLLTDKSLKMAFSQAAKNEIMTNGHIEKMCEGFRDALQYAFKQDK